MLIVVNSPPKNRRHRLNIRRTWGFYNSLPEVKIVFFVGKSGVLPIEEDLVNENRLFNDVIRVYRREKPFLMTYKTVAVLEFIMKKCPNVQFVARVDDNVFVNIPVVMRFIERHKKDERKIYGLTQIHFPTVRNISYPNYLLKKEYKAMHLPDYLAGPFYFMKGNLVPELYYTSLKTQFFKLEDIFLTGFVAPQLGLKLVHLRGIFDNGKKFKEISEIDYLVCYFLLNKLNLIYYLWSFTSEYNKAEKLA